MLFNSGSQIAKYIRGVDACSQEIGCRPEVFAPAFRKLRHNHNSSKWKQIYPIEPLGVSYHVGEDFLDIVDGLRAVGEALLFLELSQGDRIGHGLALGIDSDEWYKKKHNRVILPRQDLLDNCIFMLVELSSAGLLKPRLDQQLRREFATLSQYVYRKHLPYSERDAYISVEEYWDSWHLRGDLPICYSHYQDDKAFYTDLHNFNVSNPYCLLQHEKADGYLCNIRNGNKQAIRLYYHGSVY